MPHRFTSRFANAANAAIIALAASALACSGPAETAQDGPNGAGGSAPNGVTSVSSSSGSSDAGSAGPGGATGSGGGSCQGSTGGPAMSPYPFTLGGQAAWSHDEGFSAGYFHTYDALKVAGESDAPRKVHVFLPRAYDDACEARYPVVYMNDGNTTFWNGGAGNKSWLVADGLAKLYAEGAIPEVIVVAVHPLNREREYTHTEWAPDRDCCGAEEYTNYIADHVKGFIDANYRTLPEAASTAIIGSSHGGIAAFYMANRRPDRFGKAGCLSSSFWAGVDGIHGGDYGSGPLASSLLIELTKGTLANAAVRPRLWIDWGLVRTGGFHNEVIEAAATDRSKEMVSLLESTYGYAAGSELFSYEDPMGEHDEDAWARRFPSVMKALFGAP